MGLPFIGSSTEAPLFLRSPLRSSSDNRKNKSFPNIPKNMFPLTKAEMFPNIGRTVTRVSSGTRDWKKSIDSFSGWGIFSRNTLDLGATQRRVDEVFERPSVR